MTQLEQWRKEAFWRITAKHKICWEAEYEKGEFCIGENTASNICMNVLEAFQESLKKAIETERQKREQHLLQGEPDDRDFRMETQRKIAIWNKALELIDTVTPKK